MGLRCFDAAVAWRAPGKNCRTREISAGYHRIQCSNSYPTSPRYPPLQPLVHSCLISRHTQRGNMTIPWTAALQIARKLLPVVIDKAPDLIKTFERRRTPTPANPAPPDPAIAALQEQLDAHQETMRAQVDRIHQLHLTLAATQRSLSMAWSVLAATVLLSVSLGVILLFRS